MIDKNSPIPIYYQLEKNIKKLIEEGKLNPGDLLPSEREYGEKYGISRMTVRQAINNLVNERILYRVKGKGTFVMEHKIEQSLPGLTSFSEEMKARGMKSGVKVLSFNIIRAGKKLAEKFGMEEKDLVYEIIRIRLAEDLPMALERNYLCVERVPGINKEIVKGSIYDYIENELHLKITAGAQTLEAAIANEEEVEHLKVEENSPILLMERTTSLEDGNVFEVVKSSYRADRYKFMINMQRF